MFKDIEIIKRLYKDYTFHHIKKIILAILLSFFVAGSTSAIAYLLDPAIKKIFIEKDQTLTYLIPIFIVVAFATKGISLYIARVLMIIVGEEVKTSVQKDMMKSLIYADTQYIDKIHTGKFISNLTNDVSLLNMLISTAVLNLFKDTLTLLGLLFVMFYQNWKLSLVAIIMIPLASLMARTLGKRITKVSEQMLEQAGLFTTRLVEIFKNHKLIKIFQGEKYERSRTGDQLDILKEKLKKMSIVFYRTTPIMEVLTGIMIATLIYFSGKLIENNELEINNFFLSLLQ